MAKSKAACECVVIDKVWLIRDVRASTISLGVYQGTQLCELHIMNLKSCSVSRVSYSMSKQLMFMERVTSIKLFAIQIKC